jgi:predicted acetyltransferase
MGSLAFVVIRYYKSVCDITEVWPLRLVVQDIWFSSRRSRVRIPQGSPNSLNNIYSDILFQMLKELVPVTELSDYSASAADLCEFLGMPGNEDIEIEFPNTLSQYWDLATAEESLSRLAKRHEAGKREIFVVMAGGLTVGQAIVTLSDQTPEQVDNTWPNVSGWIVKLFRGQGLGKFSLEKRLEVVRARFGGNAWTLVNKTNAISEKNVTDLGFECLSRKLKDKPEYNLFTWENDRQRIK